MHTLLGPDHYLPFVALAQANQWTKSKALAFTFICGVGHILGSVVLGAAGIFIGSALFKLETLERIRGDVAGWLLLGLGIAYCTWGIRRAIRNRPHRHVHVHADGTIHNHEHDHQGDHVHVHDHDADAPTFGPWLLFIAFLFGPCEVLIPLFMYPAASGSWWDVVLVTTVFAVATLATMILAVSLILYASCRFSLGRFSRYSHAVAGFVVLICGVAVTIGL